MAKDTLTTYKSSLATDPLRSFRYNATFVPAGVDAVFDGRIVTDSNTTANTAGKSTGWFGGFTNITGLGINVQNITYREGGYNTTVHQIPGMTTFQPVTFTRGTLYGHDQAITWMRGMFAAAQGTGLNNRGAGSNAGFRTDIYITVNDHPNTDAANDYAKMTFKVHNAWITALNYTDLDATNGAILFETMQLVHEGLSVFFTDKDGNPVNAGPTALTKEQY
jgi:phage tail-like protein